MDRLSIWWGLAGPSNFISKTIQAVADRRRVVFVSTPAPRPEGLTQAIKRRLRDELSLDCVIVDLSGRDQSGSIAHVLAEYLEIPPTEIGSVADFARHSGLVDQVIIVDGIDPGSLRRWGLLLRQLQSEAADDALIGPIVVALLPIGLTHTQTLELCGSARMLSMLGAVDRYDTIAYASALGLRPGSELAERVGHAVTLDVAAWSKSLLEIMMGWDAFDQIDPMARLIRTSDTANYSYPSWENGLVDLWDDEPAAHAIAAAKYGLRDHIKRRIWTAQAGVMLPFANRILLSLIARHRHILAKKVSPENPYRKRYNDREQIITDPRNLEFWDFREIIKGYLSPAEFELIKIAGWARNGVAHREIIEPTKVKLLSEHYESNREILAGDIPGWNWPRSGQTMILTVGPSGAGKSRWSRAQGLEVVSSDELRRANRSDIEIEDGQSGVIKQVRTDSARILATGCDVIVDAMHADPEHRALQLSVAPPDIKVRYVIIDRPLADKKRDAGRNDKGLVEKHHAEFQNQVVSVLAGDSRSGVEVIDLRNRSEPR